MIKKFDTKSFQKDIISVINKYSDKGNRFSNAEILSGMISIVIETVRQAVADKEAGKYLLHRIIDESFTDE